MELKLEAKNESEKRIKEYLEQTASESLADKINNGSKIEKDNKPLINKKDLTGFMTYACNEARKLAEKGKNFACIEDSTVYGWAVHYFEEDEIVGTLFNEDGSEYKIETKRSSTSAKVEKPKIEKQPTLFDLINASAEKEEQEDEEDMQEIIEEFESRQKEEFVASQSIKEREYVDEDGVIFKSTEVKTFDKDLMIMLSTMLDGKLKFQ